MASGNRARAATAWEAAGAGWGLAAGSATLLFLLTGKWTLAVAGAAAGVAGIVVVAYRSSRLAAHEEAREAATREVLEVGR